MPSRPRGGTIDAAGDHRIAMLGGDRRARLARGRPDRSGPSAPAVSFPGFYDLLGDLVQTGDID